MHDLNHGFRFEGLRIEPQTGEVAGPGGREKLDPKVMEVLVYMAQRAGEVVPREDILKALWPGAVVTDDALTRCFYELRRQLSRAGGDERYRDMLETLPKRGYRLNGEVRAARSPSRWRLAVGVAAVAALAVLALYLGLRRAGPPGADPAAVRSIAVLPFTDMSPAGNQGYFADGIAEEILNRLVKASDLRVISRTSSFSFRDRNADIPRIAAKLDVTHVLEGSVRRAGDRVRITAQLISASTNAHVWSDTYDRNLGDILAVQDDIATQVAAALDATLSGTSVTRPPNPEAYELFLQARHFYNRRAPGDLQLMAKYLEEAVAIDPGFAAAWAELAGAYHLLIFEQPGSEPAWHAKRGRAALRAVELDPELAVARLRLAQHYWRAGDRARGRKQYQKAVELDPDDLLLLSINAGAALSDGDIDQAVELQSRVVARDPLSATQRNNLASYLAAAGRYEEALAEYRMRDELDLDKKPGDDADLLRLLVLLERYDEASAIASAMPEGRHRDFGVALLYPAPGQRPQADAAMRRLEARPPADDFLLAEVYAQRGMNDEAVEAFRQSLSAVKQGEPAAWANQQIRHSIYSLPFLRELRPRLLDLFVEPD